MQIVSAVSEFCLRIIKPERINQTEEGSALSAEVNIIRITAAVRQYDQQNNGQNTAGSKRAAEPAAVRGLCSGIHGRYTLIMSEARAGQ